MPQFLIEAPTGVRQDAKEQMMKRITEAIDEAYGFGDIRVWLREYRAENVAQDGKVGADPVRPLCFLEAPELADLDAKRKMAGKVHDAIHAAYHDIANTAETLILMNHYPLENAGWAGRLQSDNREAVEAIRGLNG
jgi:phenylpyruvate tautomerase PptA (4-oxalocrotonate tautomerase family)